ncbi:cytochrome P450 82A1-like [Hibiscus syriacus]|uniref:Cytochrome P450 82A1-like n=1 Tax=Hibiscus syriacus TaxID=106335 RepID=A0A6A3CPB2_HIBSY|nr:wall-associated receptor kinase-like 14 [Hibiscus syriacus]KAE8729201.1 cytochrome P450 82A1-like [Hibiscus syriacus]
MILKEPILLFLAIFISSLIVVQSTKCDRSCGDKLVPYPFGFSSGCRIPLSCSSNNHQQLNLAGFPILNISNDRIKISIEATCNRSLRALLRLYGPNYAPTSRNAILLQNCSVPAPCMIPSTMVYTHFEALACSPNGASNISCYSENKSNGFVDYSKVIKTHCKSFLSSISTEYFNESGVLEVQVVELRWWIEGRCSEFCSENAICDEVISPFNRLPGFYCRCRNGFIGDGFRAGDGCRKASSDCNPARYISGKCRGTTRVFIFVGGIAAGTCLMICAVLICCFVRRQLNSKTIQSTKSLLSEALNIKIPIYAYKEIEKATHGFSEKQRLGTGAFGTVYAGKLHNNSWVAIKRIKHRDTDCIEQVVNEIKLISSVSHPNLVRLLGCSMENGEQILVYEFMPNGTLCQHLQRERGDGLAWPVRLTIAAETAQAIAHLHSAINPPIYHRDIKSSNILLDYNFRSKVADFGLSRLGKTEISHISTAPQGTPGYLDPQYHQNFHLSDKSDVYSFGVVLMEMITALKVVDFTRLPNEANLAAVATDRISKGSLDEIIDPILDPKSDSWTLCSIHKVAELAFRCLSFHRDMRPTMMEVAIELEQIRLSRWVPGEELTHEASAEVSPCFSSSNLREQPLSKAVSKKGGVENRGLFMLQMSNVGFMNLMEKTKDNSPVSVQDPWLSEQSSPSSSSLLNNVTH